MVAINNKRKIVTAGTNQIKQEPEANRIESAMYVYVAVLDCATIKRHATYMIMKPRRSNLSYFFLACIDMRVITPRIYS